MPIVITLVLVVVFAVIVSTLLQRYAKERIGVMDVGYILVGGVLGQFGVGLFTTDVITALQPVVSLMLGVVGFSLGLALRRRLAVVPALEGGFVAAFLTAAAVAGVFYLVIDNPFFTASHLMHPALWPALAVGCAAATMSTTAIEAGARLHRAQGPATDLLRGFALAGSVLAVAFSGTALALSRSQQASNQLGLTETEWLVALIGLGAACGILFSLFMGRDEKEGDDRLFLASVGIVIFASGMASAAGMSPLLLNAIVGVVVSLISKDAGILHVKLARIEKPAEATVLIFAGAMWTPVSGIWWVCPFIYLVVRIVALRFAAATAVRMFDDLPEVHRPGNALWAQGAIAAAVAVSYAQVNPKQSSFVLTTVLVAMVIADLLSAPHLKRFIVDAGEHERIPASAPTGPAAPAEVP